MHFLYTAYDRDGRKQASTIEAADQPAARDALEARGLYVASIAPSPSRHAPTRHAAGAHAHSKRARQRPAPTHQAHPAHGPHQAQPPKAPLWNNALKRVASFTRELAVLVGTGVPVADAVRSIERQTKDDRWRAVVAAIRADVEQGEPLSEALEHHARHFDPIYRSLVAVGEESGNLADMLDRLAELVRRQLLVRTTAVGALVYPAVLLLLTGAAVLVMLVAVVPRFEGMFEALNAPLPASTEALIVASEILRDRWWAIVPAALAAAAAALVYARSAPGRRRIDRLLVSMPGLSPVVRGVAEARLARVLGTLIAAHLPLLEALDLLAGSITNSVYRDVLDRAKASVSAGNGLAPVFETSALIRPSFTEAVRSGESTGRLGEVMTRLAGYTEQDNDLALRTLSKAIEPAIIGLMGLAVGFLAISLFLPMFDISASAGGGM